MRGLHLVLISLIMFMSPKVSLMYCLGSHNFLFTTLSALMEKGKDNLSRMFHVRHNLAFFCNFFSYIKPPDSSLATVAWGNFLLPIFAQQQCDEAHSYSLSIALNLHLMSSAHQIKQECLAYCSVKKSN